MKYKNGIFIGKFYPLHFGHITVIKALSLVCENVYVLFYYREENERQLSESCGYKYNIDARIEDCKTLLNEESIHVLKLEIKDNRKFPENRATILNKINELINDSLDVQIFGAEEYGIYAPYKYADECMTSSPYTVEDEKWELVTLQASLIRKNYEWYKKYIPHLVRKRIDTLRKTMRA